MAKQQSININPDPKILEAISHNPITPIDALCELIDNSVDAFAVAEKNGIKVDTPTITISLPSNKELDNNEGKVRIEDNGPGMPLEKARSAVTAGFSGNPNPFDSLGLFGMGFNISTGKLGQVTEFLTTQKGDDSYAVIEINIPKMVQERSFDVPVQTRVKRNKELTGTIVEVSGWWPMGHMNQGFISKLARTSKAQLREQIGRRYSTLLGKNLTIIIDGEKCPVFHHCVWTEKRFVTHQTHGKIPAKMPINALLGVEYRCNKCSALMEKGQTVCPNPNCGAKDDVRTIERRLKGWVGIQRFDDPQQYGVDLIRNGRAIRVLEKQAFFTWTSEDGQQIIDYPIDSPYGRIIGEIHMNHVPVDYLKTDFQRTSPEWQEAINFLRGNTSLQPQRAAGQNESPVYLLYQGYRKVRNPGRKDLYMGYWDEGKSGGGGPARISRAVEQEYYEKFKQNLPGYGFNDDEEWYKQVLAAEERPIEGVMECPNCGFQNAKSAETCQSCNYIFKAKSCINCDSKIPLSAIVCDQCGADQTIKEDEPWKCKHCGAKNPPDATECRKCHRDRHSSDTLALDELIESSNVVDELSVPSLTIPLPSGDGMPGIKLTTHYLSSDHHMERNGERIPVFTHITSQEVSVFVDRSHPAFIQFQDRPEDYIAMEIARWIRDEYSSKVNDENRPLWSITNLYYTIHSQVWRERTEINPVDTQRNIDQLLDEILENMPVLLHDIAEEIHDGYDAEEKSRIYKQVISNEGVDTSRYDDLVKSGEYLRYLPYDLMLQLIQKYPERFFDGKLWKDPYSTLEKTVPDLKTLQEVQSGTVRRYIAELSDIVNYKGYRSPDSNYTQKINLSLQIIQNKLARTD